MGTNPVSGNPTADVSIPTDFLTYLSKSEFTAAEVKAKLASLGYSVRGKLEERVNLSKGLWGHWTGHGHPALPDNPSGVQYFQDDFATIDGWAAGTITPTVSGGKLIVAKTAASQAFAKTIAVAAGKRIKAKVRVASGAPDTANFRCSVTSSFEASYPIKTDGSWSIVDFLVTGALTAVIMYAGTYSSASTYQLEIDWIQIGDASYATQRPDLSGSLNAMSVYGATPDGDGNLVLNGSTDYLKSASTLDTVPDVWSFDIRLPAGNAQATRRQTLAQYRAQSATVGHLWIFRDVSSDLLCVGYSNGTNYVYAQAPALFTGYSAAEIRLHIAINWSNATVTADDGTTTIPAYGVAVWRNGTLFTSATMTTPVKPLAGEYLYLGGGLGGMTYLLGATLGEVRCYNRLVSAAGPWELWQNPGACASGRGPVTPLGIANALVDQSPTVKSITVTDKTVIATKTPASASAAGVAGQIAWDGSYLYICTATNTWKRAAIATW